MKSRSLYALLITAAAFHSSRRRIRVPNALTNWMLTLRNDERALVKHFLAHVRSHESTFPTHTRRAPIAARDIARN